MCECEGTGTVEIYTVGLGLREIECRNDHCTYWGNGE